jgi:hypothetical protein
MMAIHKNSTKVQAMAVFIFFLLINIVSSGGHLDWRDGVETFVVTESMILKNTAMFHPDVPSVKKLYAETWIGKYDLFSAPTFTPRSLLLSALAVPFYYVATAMLIVSPIPTVALLVNSLVLSLISLVIFLFSMELYSSKKLALTLALIFNVCSFVWPYNTSLYPQPLQALLLIAPAYLVYKSAHINPMFICCYSDQRAVDGSNRYAERKVLLYRAMAGLLLGLSIFAHPSSLIAMPGFLAYSVQSVWRRKRRLVYFLIPLAAILILVASVNYIRFGAFSEFGYYSQGSVNAHTGWEGLIGLWISPGFGMLIYFPPVILLPVALKKLTRTDEKRRLSLLVIYMIGSYWLFVGTLSYDEPMSWSGAIAWGPRYLIPLLPFIVVSLGSLFSHSRRRSLYVLKLSVIIALCLSGFVVNLIGKLIWVSYVALYMWQELLLQSLGVKYLSEVAWNLNYSLPNLHLKVLTDGDFIPQIQPIDYLGTDYHFVTYGLAPCEYDLYLYCRFGIIPPVVLLGLATILVILILGLTPLTFAIIIKKHFSRILINK